MMFPNESVLSLISRQNTIGVWLKISQLKLRLHPQIAHSRLIKNCITVIRQGDH
jgi:hypothetical protein